VEAAEVGVAAGTARSTIRQEPVKAPELTLALSIPATSMTWQAARQAAKLVMKTTQAAKTMETGRLIL